MIILHSDKEIEMMRNACMLSRDLLNYLVDLVEVGVTTEFLNIKAEEWTVSHGGVSAPLWYKGTYPKSICTSVNEQICHGIPSNDVILKDGDIINIDVTPKLNGWHGDTSKMVRVGQVSPTADRLIKTTKKCLDLAIMEVRPGANIFNIGAAIEREATAQSFSVVEEFVGHGVGRKFHSQPTVYHYKNTNYSLVLREGMIFTIEPMINEGSKHVSYSNNGWEASTLDNKNSAQYEHTVLVTHNGVDVLTE